MGRHLSLGYRPIFSFTISGLNSGGRYMNIIENREMGKAVPIALNTTHSFALNYILNRHILLVTNISIMKSTFEVPKYSISNMFENYTIDPLIAKTSGYGFLIGIRKYVANIPLGWFVSYKVGANVYSANIKYSYSAGFYPTTSNEIKVKHTNFRFIYELGKQFILTERLLLDVSLDVDFVACVFSIVDSNKRIYGENYDKYCTFFLYKRTYNRDISNINFGINYLIK